MNDFEWGIVGGSLGGLVGVAGAIYGVRASLKQCKSSAERQLVIIFSLALTAAIGLMLAGLFLIPKPYNWLVWIPYPFLLTGSILFVNRRMAALRGAQPTA